MEGLFGIFLRVLAIPILALGGWAPMMPTADDTAFSAAHARGVLRVGVPTLAPAPAAGAKIRTAERLDASIVQHLGERLGLPITLVAVPLVNASAALAAAQVDVVLAYGSDELSLDTGNELWVSTNYRTLPKAVMRNDTAVHSWDQVHGQRVCMAQDNSQAQLLASQYGARVYIYAVPAEALIAVREGRCDVGLVNDTVWEPLMRLPEWRKYSATLPQAGDRMEVGWLAMPSEAAWLAREMRNWESSGVWTDMTGQWARDVAFDVYLDQEVPDCHA